MACSTGRWTIVLGVIGLILAILGAIIGWIVVPSVVRSKISDILVLNNGSESWKRWTDLPIPIKFRIYIFDVKNPEGILSGEIPEVTERGPYVYKERRNKTVIELNANSSTVKYKQNYSFEFDPEASGNLTENDNITVLNTVAVGFVLIVDNLKEINDVITLFNTALPKMWPEENLFFKTTVKDYLFGQIPMYCNQSVSLNNIDTLILCESFKLVAPRTVALDVNNTKYFNTFSFFRYKNNTDDGIFEMDSGHDKISNIGNIKTWKEQALLEYWKGKSCNKIRGSDSTIFRPLLEVDDVKTLPVFNTDICRSINLTYEGDVEFKGVRGRRYVGDESVFGSVLVNNENYCYCPNSLKGITHFGGCLKSGILDVSTCQNAPVIVSHPHFLMADPSFNESCRGLKADKEKHKIFLDLEPYTGYPLRAASRVQINFFLKKVKEVELMKNLSNTLMPVLWIEEAIELTDDLIDELNNQLFNNLRIAEGVKWSMIVVGILLAGGTCVYYLLWFPKEKKIV